MAVASLAKVGIISTKANEHQVMETLFDFGGLQIIDKSSSDSFAQDVLERLSQYEYQLSQVKFALNFINTNRPEEKIGWREKLVKLANHGLSYNPTEINKLINSFDYLARVKVIEELGVKLNEVNLKISQLKSEIAELELWEKLPNIYQSASFERIQVKLGIVARDKFVVLQSEQSLFKLPVVLTQVFEQNNNIGLAVIFLTDKASSILEILNQFGFKEVTLPDYSAPPRELVLEKKSELTQLAEELITLQQEAGNLVQYEEKFKLLHDYLTWQCEKLSARVQADESTSVFYLRGWVEKNRLSELHQVLKKTTPHYDLLELPLAENESAPVMLKNKSFVRPFESVTNVYGSPKSHELDPTPYLAPFFILFFGLCLSDAGYGLLLALLSYLAIVLLKIPKHKQGMFRLLIYAGIMTFFIGILFGGYFGIVLEDLPEGIIKTILLQLRIIDPVKDPLTMLIFALILGVMQIIAGVIINLYYQIIRRDWSKTFDAAAWLFLMLGIVFWLIAKQVLTSDILTTFGQYWIYAGVLVLVLTQGRKAGNIFLKLPLGFLSLYNLVGYFSDIMSYSRLLALGLSTGIIAMVINIVAFLFKDMIPFIGWPVAILILLGGHIFNLAINALGSFIHSGRLQYVEFFPKFLEGGGERFKPFFRTAKYIDLYMENEKK